MIDSKAETLVRIMEALGRTHGEMFVVLCEALARLIMDQPNSPPRQAFDDVVRLIDTELRALEAQAGRDGKLLQ